MSLECPECGSRGPWLATRRLACEACWVGRRVRVEPVRRWPPARHEAEECGEPDDAFGPWLGVPRERQRLCAVEGCDAPGEEHRCPWDGSIHHHGCVHYDCVAARGTVERAGLVFRPGWGLLCAEHFRALVVADLELDEQ